MPIFRQRQALAGLLLFKATFIIRHRDISVIKRLLPFVLLFAMSFSIQADDTHSMLTGKNVLILYKKDDILSKKIAAYYADKRSVPSSQQLGIQLDSNSSTLSRSQFNQLEKTIQPHLSKNIKVILLTWTKPYRVKCMSITSAVTLGFDEQYCSHNADHQTGCHPTKNSPLFNISRSKANQSPPWRLSMMLSGENFKQAKALIDRGIEADGSDPVGDAYLVRTQDANRSTRWPIFKQLVSLWPRYKGITLHYVDDRYRVKGSSVNHKNQLMFYFTGLQQVPDINTNHYLPGAIADHLTSAGGNGIGEGGQMKTYRWLEAGATASYGTVVEPCNYPEKFPNPRILLPNYMTGDHLIQAYWKSVQQPGEGLFVGEPLARPWSAK